MTAGEGDREEAGDMTTIQTPVTVPVRTPVTDPTTEPLRRIHPDELCPAQKDRLVRRIEREV